MPQTATVNEISRRAGCSIATVSRVLNNSGAVSRKTRELVLKAMHETKYLATRTAKRSGVGRKASSGVVEIIQHRHSPVEQLSVDRGSLELSDPVSPDTQRNALSTSFHRHIVDGAIEELSRWGYRAQLRVNRDLLDPGLLADLNGPDRSGVLLIGEYSADLAAFVGQCLHPLVLVDLICQSPADSVTTDNVAGISAAFDHLWSLGHRRIGFVGKLDRVVAFSERYAAFRLKMADAGLPIRRELVYEGEDFIGATAEGVREILQRAERPTALLCANDCYAVGVVRAASDSGIKIPEQLSVIGFDDVEYAALATPPLTTVRVPLQEMGRQAVRQLMIALQGGAPTRQRGCQVRLIPDLVVRQSAAKPGN